MIDDTFNDMQWDEQCAGCGLRFPVSQMIVEEGDRWECELCWEKFEAKERITVLGLDFVL